MEQSDLTELTKRLDAIVLLLARTVPTNNDRPMREQIRLLSEAGLGPTHIGNIVGKSAKDIGSELAKIKKAKAAGAGARNG